MDFDLIVVGSGIAGLYASLLAAPHGRVLLVTKGQLEESNTRYAQGGIAAALAPQDSPELHRRDTIAAGAGLCRASAVSALTREAPERILELLRLGVPFDRDGEELAWTLEAAHSRPRVLHAGGDATGASIERTLAGAVRAAGVTIREGALCTSLVMRNDHVAGVELLLDGLTTETVAAGNVILATGGAGRLFARTTNPEVATGDGLAAAYRAGAQLADLEFFQFHPTALAVEGAPSFLISEAVRGEGGILRDRTGRGFMADYHPDRELAPRDVVARAIHRQMLLTGSCVWLDVTQLDAALVERRFPTIVSFCRGAGIDPVRQPIPVSPAAHYLMGGIRTDLWGRTSIPGLFACGEVANTGVHGANRLASNSLLEGLVFARRTATSIVEGSDQRSAISDQRPAVSAYVPAEGLGTGVSGAVAGNRLAEIMWREASVIRSAESLTRAGRDIDLLVDGSHTTGTQGQKPTAQGQTQRVPPTARERFESENLLLLARLLIAAATMREESRGAHFREDFPEHDSRWLGRIVLSREGIGFQPLAERVPAPSAVEAAG